MVYLLDNAPKMLHANYLFLGRNWSTREEGKFLRLFAYHFIFSLFTESFMPHPF